MTSGPTQNYGDADLGRWRPHPLLATVVRVALLGLPLLLALAFGLAAAHWFSAAHLGVNRWVWVAGEIALSLLVLRGGSLLAKKLLPLTSLLRLTLYFPDHAPSRLKVALRQYSPDTLRNRISAPGDGPHKLDQEQDHAERLLDMVAAIAAHDSLTAGHSERVQAYSALVGAEMGLNAQDAAKLSWAALLHDIGKLEVPAEILSKDGRPTDEEWELLSTHPRAGRELAAPLVDWLGPWINAIDQHHERWDGGGYPYGLSGTRISLGARIVAVVDAYDVITSARSYKAPLSTAAARAELARCAGSQFDPAVVRAMLAVGLGRLRAIAGPISALSALPGLGSTPLSGFASISSTLTTAVGATVATVVGATLGLAGPAALPSNASTLPRSHAVVAAQRPSTTVIPPASPSASAPAASGEPSATSGEPSAASGEPSAASSSGPTSSTAPQNPSSPGVVPVPASTSTTSPAPVATTVPTAPAPAPSPTTTGSDPCVWAQHGWTPLPGKDLNGCDLSGLTLVGSFASVNLKDANLRNATLPGTDLTDAQLVGTDLTGATLTSAVLTSANLTKTNLTGATITGTGFDEATIQQVSFGGASVTDSTFIKAKITKSTAPLTRFTRDSFAQATIQAGFFTSAVVTDCTMP